MTRDINDLGHVLEFANWTREFGYFLTTAERIHHFHVDQPGQRNRVLRVT